MGYYIETPGVTVGKAFEICAKHDAVIILKPKKFSDFPEDKALVCVVSNGPFDAAAYCYNESEFEAFNNPQDLRQKIWLVMDKLKAEQLTKFPTKTLGKEMKDEL